MRRVEARRIAADEHDHQDHDRDRGDPHGDEQQQAGPVFCVRRVPGHPAAGQPDDWNHGQDDGPERHVHLEQRGADGGERYRGSHPGQPGPLPGQARIAVFGIVGLSHRGYLTADSSKTTADRTATAVMVAVRITGRNDRGTGSPRRSACRLRTHSTYPATATIPPSTISGTPIRWRPNGTPGNGGSSWTIPSPA